MIVPLAPGGFSAWGMLSADVVNDYARTDLRNLDDVGVDELELLFAAITERGDALAGRAGRAARAGGARAPARAALPRPGARDRRGRPTASSTRSGSAPPSRSRSGARYGHTMDDPGADPQRAGARHRALRASRADRGCRRRYGDARPRPDRAPRGVRLRPAGDGRVRRLRARRGSPPATRSTARRSIDEGTSTTVVHSRPAVDGRRVRAPARSSVGQSA